LPCSPLISLAPKNQEPETNLKLAGVKIKAIGDSELYDSLEYTDMTKLIISLL